jgi:hypothetical protein
MGGHLTEQAFMHHKLSNESPTGLAQKRGVLLISILSSCSPLLWFGLVHSSYISVSQYCEHYCIVKIESQLSVSVEKNLSTLVLIVLYIIIILISKIF